MKFRFLLFIAFFCSLTYSHAQITVKGNVVDLDGVTLPGATVSVTKGKTTQGVLTNNIADDTYWAGVLNQFRLAPGAPRNVLLTVSYKF